MKQNDDSSPMVAPATGAEKPSVVPDNQDPIITRGQEAWCRLKTGQTYDDWVAVAEALRHGQHLAMLEAHTNKPSGPRYKAIIGEWLRTTGFDEIDKAARSRLLDCIKHRSEIEAWRRTLPLSKRLDLNHPNAVWRNWQKATVTGKATVVSRPSPTAKYKDEIVRLEDENARLQRAGDDLFAPQDTAPDIARLLAARLLRLSPRKAAEILKSLPRIYKTLAAERQDADAGEAQRPTRTKRRRTADDFARDMAARRATEQGATETIGCTATGGDGR